MQQIGQYTGRRIDKGQQAASRSVRGTKGMAQRTTQLISRCTVSSGKLEPSLVWAESIDFSKDQQ